MPAHGTSQAFASRDTDHVIQHVMHTYAVDHVPSAIHQICWHPQNSQLEAIKEALSQRWARNKAVEQDRLNHDNKYVYRKLELGEMRASRLMRQNTHWRKDEATSAVGTTTLNRVAAGHRIEEQNRVLFEHLLTTKPGVVTNSQLKERSKKLDEKQKTMTRFRPQPEYGMPVLPRAYPLQEGIEEETARGKLPRLPRSMRESDINEIRERGWNETTPRDLRESARRRDNRLSAGTATHGTIGLNSSMGKIATPSAVHRTYDANSWCNRESEHQKRRGTSLKAVPRLLP